MNELAHSLTVAIPAQVSLDEARLLLAVKLFEKARLTLGEAARMAGFSLRGFMDVLAAEGVPVVNYPAEELAGELAP